MKENLEYLHQLTEALPSWGEMTTFCGQGPYGYTAMNTAGSDWKVRNLLNTGSIAILDCVFKRGTYFPSHSHPEIEYIILYEGVMEVTLDDEIVFLRVGDCLAIPANKNHSVMCIEDSKAIAITIPASKDFPK